MGVLWLCLHKPPWNHVIPVVPKWGSLRELSRLPVPFYTCSCVSYSARSLEQPLPASSCQHHRLVTQAVWDHVLTELLVQHVCSHSHSTSVQFCCLHYKNLTLFLCLSCPTRQMWFQQHNSPSSICLHCLKHYSIHWIIYFLVFCYLHSTCQHLF